MSCDATASAEPAHSGGAVAGVTAGRGHPQLHAPPLPSVCRPRSAPKRPAAAGSLGGGGAKRRAAAAGGVAGTMERLAAADRFPRPPGVPAHSFPTLPPSSAAAAAAEAPLRELVLTACAERSAPAVAEIRHRLLRAIAVMEAGIERRVAEDDAAAAAAAEAGVVAGPRNSADVGACKSR